MPGAPSAVVWDIGGVLIDWNPRYLYSKLFAGDKAAMERFLATVCTQSWNEKQDAGRTFAEGCSLLKKDHPQHSELIDAWFARYEEMLGGAIEGSVAILSQLRTNHVRLYALSNWSAETFPFARKRFEFLKWFHGLLLSGEAGLMKPDPQIFQMLFDRYAIDPTDAIYIDDHLSNVEAARGLGMRAIHFTDPDSLRRQLDRWGLTLS